MIYLISLDCILKTKYLKIHIVYNKLLVLNMIIMIFTDEIVEQLTILDELLKDTEKETLFAFVITLDRSTNARCSFERMLDNLNSEYKKDSEKFKEIRRHSVKILIRKGLLIKHPSGTMTYQISKTALLYYFWKVGT